ncbi:MAG: DNA polymerase III subunit delta [Planctomycetota bacterium]
MTFLAKTPATLPGIIVLFGNETFLKSQVRARIRASFATDDESPMSTVYDGTTAQLRDVVDDLSMRSLFGGGGRRLIFVDDADPFVTTYREELEQYAERPKSIGLLLLDCKIWLAISRLAKIVLRTGLAIDCKVPTVGAGKSPEPDDKLFKKWLVSQARTVHKIQVSADVADLIYDLVGPNFGILDNELAKLALLTAPQAAVTEELVKDLVGGWRVKSLWEMLDLVFSGNAAGALQTLDRLLQSGQAPIAVFGGLAYGARQLAAATRIFQLAERRRKPISLTEAITQAGIRDWPRGKVKQTEEHLKQLNRQRAGQLYRWLLQLDLSLKGSHSSPAKARLAIEEFMFKLSRSAVQVARRT